MCIAARAGPIELPIILNILLIPIVTPENSLGVATRMMFIAPTAAKDKPADTIANPTDINISDECNKNIIVNPVVVKTEPKIVGFKEPSRDMISPDVGPNINSTIANGN